MSKIQTPLTSEDIEFLENYYDPCSLIENLVPININTPQTWPKSDIIYVRDYQLPALNYAYMYADDPKLTNAQNFKIKRMAGDCYMIAARGTGKSFLLIIDCVLSIIHGFREITVASCNDEKLKKICAPIASFIESHKFLKMFHLKESRSSCVKRDPLTVTTEHGVKVYSVNEKSDEEEPGIQYHSKHSFVRYFEEYSYASAKGAIKAVDAVDPDVGCIERPSGIPDLCIGSPLGKIIEDPKKKAWIWRLPAMVMSSWTKQVEDEKAEHYSGKNSAQYKLNILAEVIEGAFGHWDMPRLRECALNKNKRIKFFEIGKDEYNTFEQRLIIERMSGATQCFISLDEGYGAAPTDINIIFYDGAKYKYVYNICLFRLTGDEQAKVIKWIYDKLGTAFIASDSTCAGGKVIDELFKLGVPEEHLLKVLFTENIDIDFETDEQGNMLTDKNGEPIMKKANTMDFAEQELQRIIYGEMLEVPIDEKFLNQFTNRFMIKTGTKIKPHSKGEDHLYASFLVFAISLFNNQWKILRNRKQEKPCFLVT